MTRHRTRLLLFARTCALLLFVSVAVPEAASKTSQSDATAAADALLQDYLTSCPAIAVGVVKNGEVIYAKAAGFADLENKVTATTETNFRLASFTKQFTAMGIMMLIEQKKLSLTSTLKDLFPAFPDYGKGITVRQLLNHTSGLHDYENLMPTTSTMPLLDRDVLWLLARQDRASTVPGTQYNYSNCGYAMLAVIIERISGQTFAAFMKTHIFDRIGMSRTVVNERDITHIESRALGYSRATGGFKNTDQSMTSFVCGDGGIYSSISDLVKWDRALTTADLVSTEMLQMAWTADPVTVDKKGVGYGFGWSVSSYRGRRCIAHSGGTSGFSTRIERYPDDRFTVIVLMNRSGGDLTVAGRLADLFLF